MPGGRPIGVVRGKLLESNGAQREQSVVVIGVNYRSDDVALEFVRSLGQASHSGRVTIVLVDNTERDDSSALFQLVRRESPNAMCMKAPSNLGYFGGARFGLSEYLNRAELPDWIIVSNVDIDFRNVGFLKGLQNLAGLSDVGVVAPCIWSDIYARDRNPKMVARMTRRQIHFYIWLYRHRYLAMAYVFVACQAKQLLRVFAHDKSPSAGCEVEHEMRPRPIYAAQGSCIIFTKEYFLRGGNLNHPSFLFHEEIFVAETARRLNLQVVYDPRIQVFHNDHVSTGRFYSSRMISYLYESSVAIAREYYG